MVRLKHAFSSTRPSPSGPPDLLGGWAIQGLKDTLPWDPSVASFSTLENCARIAVSGRHRHDILRNLLGTVATHVPSPLAIAHCDSTYTPTFTDALDVNSDSSWLNDPSDKDEYFQDGEPWPPGYVPDYLRIKYYNPIPKPLLSAFTPRALISTAIRCALLCYVPVLENYLTVEDSEELENPAGGIVQKPVPDLVQPAWMTLRTGVREVTIITTRRVLERVAIAHFSGRLACKILKDYSDSALRKYARGLRGIPFALRVFRTTWHSHGLAVVAVILVQCCIDMWHTGVRLYKVDWEQKNREERLRILHIEGALVVKNVAGNTFRGSVALVGACVGASVGSVVLVGTGTWVGGFIGEMVAGSVSRKLWLDMWTLYS